MFTMMLLRGSDLSENEDNNNETKKIVRVQSGQTTTICPT